MNREATKKCAHRGLTSVVVAQPVPTLGSAPNCTQRSVSASASKWSEAASRLEGEEEGAHRGIKCELSGRAGEQPFSTEILAQTAARCPSPAQLPSPASAATLLSLEDSVHWYLTDLPDMVSSVFFRPSHRHRGGHFRLTGERRSRMHGGGARTASRPNRDTTGRTPTCPTGARCPPPPPGASANRLSPPSRAAF